MPGDAHARALEALTTFHVTDVTVGQTLDRIAEAAREAIPATAVVGMSMLGDDARPTTAIYTDEASPEVDAAQYREGRGPCLDAWRSHKAVSVPRIADSCADYPGFAAACLEHGIQSTLSLPLASGDSGMGAMNLYARSEEAFDADDEDLGMRIAAIAAVVLANVSAYWTAFDLSQNLTQAMKSRAVIEQAKGMLMAATPGMTPDGAFDLLRRASQRENVKLNQIALRIVERRGPPPREEHG